MVGELHRVLLKGGGNDIIQVPFKIHNAVHIGGSDEYIQVLFQVRWRKCGFLFENNFKLWRG